MSCNCESFALKARNKITIQVATLSNDGYGGQVESWETYKQVWAIIQPRSGREAVIQEQLQSRVDSYITIRYISALSDSKDGAKYRILFNNRYFNILSVQNFNGLDYKLEGKQFQRLICQEGSI